MLSMSCRTFFNSAFICRLWLKSPSNRRLTSRSDLVHPSIVSIFPVGGRLCRFKLTFPECRVSWDSSLSKFFESDSIVSCFRFRFLSIFGVEELKLDFNYSGDGFKLQICPVFGSREFVLSLNHLFT